MRSLVFALATVAISASARQTAPLLTRLDHVPVAVADLERAGDQYRKLGFVLKPGTPHANGIRNLHAKFPDGTEIELITAPEGVDDLTRTYRKHLIAGDGPAFLALHAPDGAAMTRAIPEGHAVRRYVFFGQLNRSPTDKPEHFEHPNGAGSIVSVWLASDDFSAERDLFARARVPIANESIGAPFNLTAPVARLGGDAVLMLPGKFQRVPGRTIIGATVQVRSLIIVTGVLKQGGVPYTVGVDATGRRSILIAPADACGWQLQFVERQATAR